MAIFFFSTIKLPDAKARGSPTLQDGLFFYGDWKHYRTFFYVLIAPQPGQGNDIQLGNVFEVELLQLIFSIFIYLFILE